MAKTTLHNLYYDPARPSAFSSLEKLRSAVRGGEGGGKLSLDALQAWLQKQDAYTLHRQARKRFARNPYLVTNIYDLWECDLLDVSSLAKYNDNHTFILCVIDVFSKYLHLIPIKTKTGPSVTAAFRSIFSPKRRRRPIWVRSDKGKEFQNKHFQDMLRSEGIQFQVCRNPDVKCAVVERVQRTIRDRLYKYFTYKNTYRYIDILPKFVKAYNDSVHSTTGMAPSRVTDSHVLAIWRRMQEGSKRIREGPLPPKFRVGQHVRISREKMRFAKAAEQTFSTEIFRVVKVIDRRPRTVYELEDLNKTPIEGQFYGEELTPVRFSQSTHFKIDKILRRRTRAGIREFLVRWRGYGRDFDSWVPAASLKKI